MRQTPLEGGGGALPTHLAGDVAAPLAAARLRQRRAARAVPHTGHPELLGRSDEVHDGTGAGGLRGMAIKEFGA